MWRRQQQQQQLGTVRAAEMHHEQMGTTAGIALVTA
jgi:hypothetical protein